MGWGKPFRKAQHSVSNAIAAIPVVGKPVQSALRSFDDNVTQPVAKATEDAAQDVWNTTTQAPGKLAEKITGSDKLQNLINPPTWEEWGKPGEAFYNEVNDGIKYVPTKELRQYAPQIIGTALNFVPGVGWALSAGFNTLYNAGAMQANNKGMNWGAVGKDALKNFGTAYAGKLAGDALKASKATQASKTFAASDSGMRAGFDATSQATGLPQTSSSLGKSALSSFDAASQAGQSAAGITAADLAKYGSSVDLARLQASSMRPGSIASGAKTSATASSVPSLQSSAQAAATPNMVDKAYNSTMSNLSTEGQATSQMQGIGASMLTDTLAPKQNTALSGFDTSGDIQGGGEIYQPTGSDVFNAFGGSAIGSRDLISEDQYNQMQQDLMLNMGKQVNATRDTMLPAGQVEPDPNTPYSGRLEDISTSYQKSNVDLANYVNQENYGRAKAQIDEINAANQSSYGRAKAQIDEINAANQSSYDAYNKSLQDSIIQANPFVTPEQFTGWLNDRSTIPEPLQPSFINAPTPIALPQQPTPIALPQQPTLVGF